ncbi:amidohydrolase-domain-containing protein [Astrocystis sublimbata]|nr:amidohydrolase-domain-containing protein [Astrocystis sublimbata]
MMASLQQPPRRQLALLDRVIDATPIIDHHAHPLLKREFMSDCPLLSITSEANGDALQHTRSSLAHIRAVNQLAQVLHCEPTWDAVASSILQQRGNSHETWIRQCLDGIETILVDDGLGIPGKAESYSWHDSFTKSACKRIVRIESVVEEIIGGYCSEAAEGWEPSNPNGGWSEDIMSNFREQIETCLADPEVAGFKSVICYRGGLNIVSKDQFSRAGAEQELSNLVNDHATGQRYFTERLQHGAPNQLIVHEVARLISESELPFKKPFQFHTGLGDNDINLTTASPSLLQTFIKDYPAVPVVILHAGYPWMREAAYLAAMYSNAFVDIGEVFPVISRHGQESVVRQILELCPWEKVLWSTDGHLLPETYLLATKQVRSVLKTVLGEFVHSGDLNEVQASTLAQDILFTNAKKLYDLEIKTQLVTPDQLNTT